jgi:SAM-dependent methyltransferase
MAGRRLRRHTMRPVAQDPHAADGSVKNTMTRVEAPLLDDQALERSWVVANRDMNRQRRLAGVNSYARELGFDPLTVLRDGLATARGRPSRSPCPVAWLDLCCGEGRALAEAAGRLAEDGLAGQVELVGVDLVDGFVRCLPGPAAPTLVAASVVDWQPRRAFDLITCVHGLHYVGDKLGMLTRALSWLTPAGLFVADLDVGDVRLAGGAPDSRRVARLLRAQGVAYDPRRHRVRCVGRRELRLPVRYLGADDQGGPNYTGQPSVTSYYTVDVSR